MAFTQGTSEVLTATWRTNVGGPLAPVIGAAITITPVAGGAPVIGPTSAGISYPTVGVTTYTWAISGALPDGTYLVSWSAVDAEGDIVPATELVELAAPVDVYTDLATVRSALTLKANDAPKDALILAAIAAASRQIDEWTGRRFYADATASARTFPVSRWSTWRDGELVLLVEDIATDADLAVAGGGPGSWAPLTGWEADTQNLTRGRPITELYGATGWCSGTGRVQVTARWGWPRVPDAISQAALLQATRLYARKNSPEGVLGSSEWGVSRVSRADPDVAALIAPYVITSIA